VRTRQLLLVIHTRMDSSYLRSVFSIMVLLMAYSISSTVVVVFIMIVSRVINTSLSVHRSGFRIMVTMLCFFFLHTTMMNG
jgi:hypothetical protein